MLQGDLILQGGGDPLLCPDDLRAMAHALAQGDPTAGLAPITRVTGRLRLDDSCFPCHGPLVEPSWIASDLPWYYAAPACGLSCNHNAVTVTVRGARAGEPANVTLTPPTALFTIDNQAMTSAEVKTGAVKVDPRGEQVRVTGRIAPGVKISEKISIADPARLVDEQFRQALAAEHITVEGNDTIGTADPPTVLLTHQSPSLPDILTFMLKESDNHTAEQLRWTLLARLQQEQTLAQRFSAVQGDFAQRAGLLPDDLRLVDGSGLSLSNHLTPQGMVHLLAYLAASPNFPVFYQALPSAATDGTLKTRMQGTPAAQNVHAKTGTMRGISTLAGYVTTQQGEQLAFAIFINGYTSGAKEARDLQDAIASYLAGQ